MKWWTSIVVFAINIKNLKKTKTLNIFQKTLSISIVYGKYSHEYKKIFKEKEPIEILHIIGLIWKSVRKLLDTSKENISQ